jgi:hypothetical protein
VDSRGADVYTIYPRLREHQQPTCRVRRARFLRTNQLLTWDGVTSLILPRVEVAIDHRCVLFEPFPAVIVVLMHRCADRSAGHGAMTTQRLKRARQLSHLRFHRKKYKCTILTVQNMQMLPMKKLPHTFSMCEMRR